MDIISTPCPLPNGKRQQIREEEERGYGIYFLRSLLAGGWVIAAAFLFQGLVSLLRNPL